MKKIFVSLVVLALLGITSSYTFADDGQDYDTSYASGSMMKQKKEMNEMKKGTRDEMKANKDEMKNNKKEFKDQYKDEMKAFSGTLTTDQKTQLKTLQDTHKTQMDTLMTELKAAKGDEVKTKELFTKIESTRATHLDQVKAIVGENSEFAKMIEAKKGVFEENKALRDENKTKRQELKTGIEDKVSKYKGQFVQKISKKLEKLTPTQVQKIIDKVDAQLTKVSANTILSTENKTKLTAQLVALKETLEDKLDTTDAEQDMLDVQSMIESVGQ